MLSQFVTIRNYSVFRHKNGMFRHKNIRTKKLSVISFKFSVAGFELWYDWRYICR